MSRITTPGELCPHCASCGWYSRNFDYFAIDYEGVHYQLRVDVADLDDPGTSGGIAELTADGELVTRLVVQCDAIGIPADCGARYPVYLALQTQTRARYDV